MNGRKNISFVNQDERNLIKHMIYMKIKGILIIYHADNSKISWHSCLNQNLNTTNRKKTSTLMKELNSKFDFKTLK